MAEVLVDCGETSNGAITMPGAIMNGMEDVPDSNDIVTASNDSLGNLLENGKTGADTLRGLGLKRDQDLFDQQISLQPDAPRSPKFAALPYASLQTGLVYDVRMRFHVESLPTEDDLHPEDPRRIHAIFEAFVAAGLAWRPGSALPLAEWHMGRINTRLATEDEVCLVHTRSHWDWVQSLKTKTPEQLRVEIQHPEEQSRMDSVYLSPNTPYCAALSAGGAIEACRAVVMGKVKNAFAVIRPPGHHAEREDAKGFCFFDNVSIAAKVCQQEFPETCQRVLILDWDVHHGNGIQQAHYDNPDVLYISLHVHRGGTFYPELSYRDSRRSYGDHLHCGTGEGLGKNVNIPWSKFEMGDADYIYAFQQIVMPIGLEFDPDLVIIAAGFDAAAGDMLGGCLVTPAGYAQMTHMLMSLARGKLTVCLEGGYNLDSIAKSATAVAKTMMGETPGRIENLEPTPSGLLDIKRVLHVQSNYWNSLIPKNVSERVLDPPFGVHMHIIVRQWQASRLWDEHQMFALSINKDQISRSLDNQVLATPDYMEARPLLVLIHDPPDMVASPDLVTGVLQQHNTWVNDVIKSYIDTAVSYGFAVIDVNIPKYLVADDETNGHQEEAETPDGASQATQLLTYIFENYIQASEATSVFLLGTDAGHAAITNFIKANEDDAIEHISKTIHFVHGASLQAVRSATNDELTPWYYRKSRVRLYAEHNFWTTEFARKPKKKYGNLMKSHGETIADMLIDHKDEVFGMLLEETEEWRSENQHMPRSVEHDVEMDLSGSPLAKKLPPVSNFALTGSPRAGTNMAQR